MLCSLFWWKASETPEGILLLPKKLSFEPYWASCLQRKCRCNWYSLPTSADDPLTSLPTLCWLFPNSILESCFRSSVTWRILHLPKDLSTMRRNRVRMTLEFETESHLPMCSKRLWTSRSPTTGCPLQPLKLRSVLEFRSRPTATATHSLLRFPLILLPLVVQFWSPIAICHVFRRAIDFQLKLLVFMYRLLRRLMLLTSCLKRWNRLELIFSLFYCLSTMFILSLNWLTAQSLLLFCE